MSRRLIMILSLALVVGLSFSAAYAEVQNVKVSGDITAMGLSRELSLDNNNNYYTNPNTEANSKMHSNMISIARLRVDADLTDNVGTTLRLINDRYWGSDDVTTTNSDIDLDLAFVTLKEFLYSPATLTVGRQEIRFGNGMVVGDATQLGAALDSNLAVRDLDLSTRKAFDAVRLTLDYNPLVIDIIGAKIQENNGELNDDQNLYGINAGYELDKNTKVEAYWFEKEGQPGFNAQNKADYVNTVGARVVNTAIKNFTLQAETAGQWGKAVVDASNCATRKAWAVELAATYARQDKKYSPTLTALYSYFSGQKTKSTETVRGWDPMFEDQSFGHIANALFPQSNVHLFGLAGTMKPFEDISLKGEYYLYWWDKIYDNQLLLTKAGQTVAMKHQKFAGQEVDVTATYDYTEDVQFSLLSGVFVPGGSFDKTDNLATEVIGSMKVTF